VSALAATGEICPFTLILRSSATRTSHEPDAIYSYSIV
jgi:hypothetical protein